MCIWVNCLTITYKSCLQNKKRGGRFRRRRRIKSATSDTMPARHCVYSGHEVWGRRWRRQRIFTKESSAKLHRRRFQPLSVQQDRPRRVVPAQLRPHSEKVEPQTERPRTTQNPTSPFRIRIRIASRHPLRHSGQWLWLRWFRIVWTVITKF